MTRMHTIVLKPSATDLRDLRRMFEARGGDRYGISFDAFLLEIVQVALSDFRLQKPAIANRIDESPVPVASSSRPMTQDEGFIQKVLRLSGNMSAAAIGRRCGVGTSTVLRILAAHREKNGRIRGRRRGWDREEVGQAICAGMNPVEIRRQFGISETALWSLRRALGQFQDRRKLNRRVFSPNEVNEIRAELAAGIPKVQIQKRHRTDWRRIQEELDKTSRTIG